MQDFIQAVLQFFTELFAALQAFLGSSFELGGLIPGLTTTTTESQGE